MLIIKHEIEVVLVVVAANVENPYETRYLLMEDGDKLILPWSHLRELSLLETAAAILDDCTGLMAKVGGEGWVELVSFPPLERPLEPEARRAITVPFGCIIPEPVKLLDGGTAWLTFEEWRRREFAFGDLGILTEVVGKL